MIPAAKLNALDEVVKQRLLQRNMFNNSLQWKSNLNNLNIESVINPLPCSNAIVCTQSENIPEESYKQFAKEFHSMNINKTNSKVEIEAVAKLVPLTDAEIARESPKLFHKNNAGRRGLKTCEGKKAQTKQLRNIDAGEVLQNRYFNSKIGKNKKYQLEEPDYDDVDISTVVKKPPTKKTKFTKNIKKNINDNLEDDFVEGLSSNKKKPLLNLDFKTAKQELHQNKHDYKIANEPNPDSAAIINNEESSSTVQNNNNQRKVGNKRNASGKFISPMLSNISDSTVAAASSSKSQEWLDAAISTNSDLKLIEPRMVELIRSEIMDRGPSVEWADIAGLEFAKQAVQEAVVWPMLRPDIFKGLRRPPKGILFFGPPGTGKTLIGKCVASQSKSTFFTISASSLTSKWVGEGEKMVRALFTVARSCQPAVIFIDEVDSLLSQRSDGEHESSRRIKTEFLVQLDGATTDAEERLLVIGATNRPRELDEAARRRFTKRLYIPLPEQEARLQLVKRLMSNEKHALSELNLEKISELSNGFSGADMRNLCAEACLGPIRSIDINKIASIDAKEVPAVEMKDFLSSFGRVRPSVCQNDLEQYVQWDTTYGSGI